MNAKRDGRGRFGPGNCANPNGGPKKTEEQFAHEEAVRVIDERAPILMAQAFDRIDRGEADLMGPALTVLGAILQARNLVEADRQRTEERALVERQFAMATAPTTH